MSRIVFILDDAANRADIVMRLQRLTGRGLNEIRNALTDSSPVVEIDLYEGDFDSHATLLRSVLNCINEFSLRSKIYELPEGQTMKTCSFVDKCEISSEVLLNILRSDEEERDRQLSK